MEGNAAAPTADVQTDAPETPENAPPSGGAQAASQGVIDKPSGKRTLADQGSLQKPPEGGQAAKEKEPPKPPERRKYKFKVDGQEIEEELDETEVHTRLQKARAADKRFQEMAEQRKKFEAALKLGKEDPAAALKQLFDVDFDEIAERRLAERYQEALLPENEREMQRLQKQIADYQKKETEAQQAQEQSKKQAFEQQVWQETEATFVQALDKLGFDKGFARTALLPMMADIAEANLEFGLELSPDQMANEVNKRLKTIHQKQVSSLKGEGLLKYLGDETVKEVLRAKLETVRRAPPVPRQTQPREEPREQTNERHFMSPSEFRRKHILESL